jgi:hypothetical protein
MKKRNTGTVVFGAMKRLRLPHWQPSTALQVKRLGLTDHPLYPKPEQKQ